MINFEKTIFDSAYNGSLDEIKQKVQESADAVTMKDTVRFKFNKLLFLSLILFKMFYIL